MKKLVTLVICFCLFGQYSFAFDFDRDCDVDGTDLAIFNERVVENTIYNKYVTTMAIRFAQTGCQHILVSNYFKEDATAQAIIMGEGGFRFSSLFDNVTHPMNVDTSLFQYKIWSTLKMLGYALPDVQYENRYHRWVRVFQERHNLSVTDVITSEFVQVLDAAMYVHEKDMESALVGFPINKEYQYRTYSVSYEEHEANEPPKDHIRWYYNELLRTLPVSIAPMNLLNLHYFFTYQSHGVVRYETNIGYVLNYLPGAAPLGRTTSGIYKVTRQAPNDVFSVSIFMHEYAHQVDALSYWYFAPDAGMIDTSGFYNILFDMQTCTTNIAGWKTCTPHVDSKFVSGYALSWENPDSPGQFSVSESFAESFALYVTQGELFRSLRSVDPSYQAQYAWLRDSVFEGVEYCTGSAEMISYKTAWDYSNGNVPDGVSYVNDSFIRESATEAEPIIQIRSFSKVCSQ